MRRWYSAVVALLLPVALVALLWRGIKQRGYWRNLRERFGLGAALPGEALWLHAVSLGEMTAAAPLIRALRARYPQASLLLTTATPTGRERAAALFGDAVVVRYLPFDTLGGMRRFMARIRPRIAIIMETELWPNLFAACRERAVPVTLVSARLSQKSVRRYRRFGTLFREVFTGDAHVATQSAEDAARFLAIGADPARTSVVGNLKFDVEFGAATLERGRHLRAQRWGGRPTWIAGSTHAGEEEALLDAHATLRAVLPEALLLLVPRHPVRFQSVADLLARRGLRFERRSSDNVVRADSTVLLVDTVGELATLYAASDVAFVGGSLVPVGGHNLLEPAALGLPVITGPSHANARDIARMLLQAGAALEVVDATALGAVLLRLFGDQAERARIAQCGLQVVAANRGTLGRVLDLVTGLLTSRPAP